MTAYQKITVLGIAAFGFLCLTVFLGITGLNYALHKAAGIATACFAFGHLGMIVRSRLKK